jgi:hypothetical protein
MSGWEYHVVPAPRRGVKARGARTSEERFSVALSEAMNALGADGWDYVRTDILPCDERQGLTGKATVYHAMMVFRRPLVTAEAAAEPAPPMARLPSPAAMPTATPPVPSPVQAEPPAAPRPLGPAERHLAD